MRVIRTNNHDRRTLDKRAELGSAGYDRARFTLLSAADADGNTYCIELTRAEAQTALEMLQRMFPTLPQA